MSWNKTESFKLTIYIIYILKIVSVTTAILSGLLCWMFSVATTVSTASLNQQSISAAQRSGLQDTINISNNLAGITFWLLIVSLVFAIIHFLQTKDHNKEAKNKLVGLIAFSVILIVSIVLRDNILQRLIVNS